MFLLHVYSGDAKETVLCILTSTRRRREKKLEIGKEVRVKKEEGKKKKIVGKRKQ